MRILISFLLIFAALISNYVCAQEDQEKGQNITEAVQAEKIELNEEELLDLMSEDDFSDEDEEDLDDDEFEDEDDEFEDDDEEFEDDLDDEDDEFFEDDE